MPIFTGFMSSHPNVKAIFIDHGNLTSAIPTYMKAANLAPGSVYAAGFDMSPATVQGIQDGYISLVIDQQEWLQGYFGIEQLCLTKSTASAACTSTPVAGSSTSRTSTRSRRSSRSRFVVRCL